MGTPNERPQPCLSGAQRPMAAHYLLRGVLQEHGLQVYTLGGDRFYAWCGPHACPTLVDSLAATLEAECPACVAQRQVELQRRSLELSIAAVEQVVAYQQVAHRLQVQAV
jgi:hypothetical protein